MAHEVLRDREPADGHLDSAGGGVVAAGVPLDKSEGVVKDKDLLAVG